MDFRVFDRARRQVGPLELDLVESYAKGILPRREFVRRGTLIGLSLPVISAIISACGSDDDGGSGGSAGTSGGTGTAPAGTGTGAAGGTIKVASQKPAGPLDPVAMQDLGSYGIIAQCFEFLCTLGDDDIAPGLAESWSPNEDGSGVDVQFAPGRQVAGRLGLHVRRRRRHHGPPRGSRQLRAQGGHRGGRGRLVRSQRRCLHPGRGERQLPVSRLGLQRAVGHHPGLLRDGHHARRHAQRDRRVQAGALRRRHRGHFRPQRHLVGRPDAAGRLGMAVLRRPGRHGDHDDCRRGRRHRAVPGHRRRRPVQRQQLQRAGLPGRHPSADLDALRHRPVRGQAGPPGAGPDLRPASR